MRSYRDARIGVIGLGYVGLPLAVEFGKHYPTLGFDISTGRIEELDEGIDITREVEPKELANAHALHFSSDPSALKTCNTYIVTVPSPIDGHKRPDLTSLIQASESVGHAISRGDVVIYESTVYPGATDEVCIPAVERVSQLKLNVDFHAGYSPERINPGDHEHRLTSIVKVTSGSSLEAGRYVDELYASIISAGTHPVSSMRVAEAAKVIENTQRDLNIALINELAMIFERLDLDTTEVLEAANTKWNFLNFKPGLVGGHCIGVDPYYLTHKAQAIGYHPEIILAGRRINDSMGGYVAERVLKLMTRRKVHVADSRILVMGLAFKENCPDIRNTRVIDVIRELQSYHAGVDVYDPWVDPEHASATYGIDLVDELRPGTYDAIVMAVAHEQFRALDATKLRALGKPNCVLFDVKDVLPKDDVDARL